VLPGFLPLGTLLERMSGGPARVFGIERPRVAVGARANLVLLDLERQWRVGDDAFRSRSNNSWLLGETLAGSIAMTLASGAVVHG
jgi:dihydroorotase